MQHLPDAQRQPLQAGLLAQAVPVRLGQMVPC